MSSLHWFLFRLYSFLYNLILWSGTRLRSMCLDCRVIRNYRSLLFCETISYSYVTTVADAFRDDVFCNTCCTGSLFSWTVALRWSRSCPRREPCHGYGGFDTTRMQQVAYLHISCMMIYVKFSFSCGSAHVCMRLGITFQICIYIHKYRYTLHTHMYSDFLPHAYARFTCFLSY